MKTLTVKQPWASLIVHGIKDIENRTWKTNFRGRVLIHAGATPVVKYKDFCLMKIWEMGMTDEMIIKANEDQSINDHYGRWRECLKDNSAIIGSVEIVECVINHPSIWAEKTEWKYSVGGPVGNQEYIHPVIYNWVLANPILFPKPLPAKGKLSFWEYTGELPEKY